MNRVPLSVLRTTTASTAALTCVLVALFAVTPQVRDNNPHQRAPRPIDILDDMARADLAAHGKTSRATALADVDDTSLLVATRIGDVNRVKAAVAECHGHVRYEQEQIGYLRVTVPVSCIRTLEQHQGVVRARLDALPTTDSYPWVDDIRLDRRARPSPHIVPPVSPPVASAPAPETPMAPAEAVRRRDLINGGDVMRLATLRDTHPTFDGRGVTIAVVEGGAPAVDLNHPAMRSATTLDGRPVPKVADIISAANDLTHRVVVPAHVFTAPETRIDLDADGLWQLPRAGTFAIGHFEYNAQLFFVLWDPKAGVGWIDINHNGNFADEQSIPDSRTKPTETTFKASEVPWPTMHVQLWFRPDGQSVIVNFANGRHGLMCASVAAGSSDPDNLAVGIAPGARVVLAGMSDVESSVHGSLEGLLEAMANPEVDLVTTSSTMLQDTPGGDDGFAGLILSRAVKSFNKILIAAAGNTTGIETTYSSAGVIPIGAYAEGNVARRMEGQTVTQRDDIVVPYSARGPRPNGALSPMFVAPTYRTAALPCDDQVWKTRQPREFDLPRCYSVSGGTSASAPIFAGVVASLLSGLKQQGLEVSVERLRWALQASAKTVEGWPSHAQGFGLPQADGAWSLLTSSARLPVIRVQGGVRHVLSEYDESGIAPGLYEREGWAAGDRASRTIVLTRTSGAIAATTYDLVWLNNDGTFESDSSIDLPLNTPVKLIVRIAPPTSGMHSSILAVRTVDSGIAVAHVPCAVLAADRFTTDNRFTLRYEDKTDPSEPWYHSFVVPPGAQSLQIQYASTSLLSFRVYEPAGWLYHRLKIDSAAFRGVSTITTDKLQVIDIPSPPAGTWVFMARYLPPGPQEPGRATAVVSIRGLDVVKAPHHESTLDVSAHERFGALAFNPSISSGTLTRSSVSVEPSGDPAIYSFTVDKNRRGFQINASTDSEKFHAYLYECTTGTCQRYDSLIPAEQRYEVRVNNPSQGLWKLVVTSGPRVRAPFTISLDRVFVDSDTSAVATAELLDRTASDATIRVYRRVDTQSTPDQVLLLNADPGQMTPCHPGRNDISTEPTAGCLVRPGVMLPLEGASPARPPQPTMINGRRQ